MSAAAGVSSSDASSCTARVQLHRPQHMLIVLQRLLNRTRRTLASAADEIVMIFDQSFAVQRYVVGASESIYPR